VGSNNQPTVSLLGMLGLEIAKFTFNGNLTQLSYQEPIIYVVW